MSTSSEQLKLREYINQVVNDPQYKEISRIPLVSWHQIGLIVFAYLAVCVPIWLHLSYGVSIWLLYPIMIFGIYTAFTPLHEATHKALSSSKFLNDVLGTISGFLLIPFSNAIGYRFIHMTHHRYVGDEDLDPDELLVSIPTRYFPFGYLVLLIPDVIWAYWLYAKIWKRTPTRMKWNITGMLLGNFLFHILWFMSPFWYEYLILFFIPNRLGIAYTGFAFAHIQHGDGELWDDHPFQATFKMKGNFVYLETLWGQANHHLHHFLPHIPWFRYKSALELANGIFNKQAIPQKGVFEKPDKRYREKISSNDSLVHKTSLSLKLAEIKEVGPDIKSFILEDFDGNELPEFTAGSHINISLPSGKVRSYSLVNSPLERHRYQIAVKREENGKGGSRELHDAVSPGDILTVSAPKNNFVLYEDVQRYILISGGIGITPLLSMAHRLTEIDKHFELHICARDRENLAFSKELEGWTFAPNVEIHLDKNGRSSLDPSTLLATPDNNTLVYVCGPAGFNNWIRQCALDLGWKPEQIQQELFSMDASMQTENREFEVELAKSGKTLTVGKDLSIIDAMLMNNVKAEYTCLQGTCGTCITNVLEGEVEHRDSVLREEEKMEGKKICLCVSRAKVGKIVIDL